uniref:Uncharacterized protein n=1 Tax=Rhizophora mucronata TaxID=61149 RepID=A0A2P2Q553_RHIMU
MFIHFVSPVGLYCTLGSKRRAMSCNPLANKIHEYA